MIEGFKQPCNLFLKKMTLIFPEPQMQQKRVHVFFFLLSWCLYHWVFSRSEGQIPPHNLEAGGSENPARGVASKIHGDTTKNRCKSTMVEIFTTQPRPTTPIPKKKGVSLSQPFFATKKIPSNNLPLQHSTTPWNTSLPLVQIWSPAPRAWYVLCCKPRKMPLWTLQNGQSRPPKRKTHLKQMESVWYNLHFFALSHILDRCFFMFSLLVQNVANTCTVQSLSQP